MFLAYRVRLCTIYDSTFSEMDFIRSHFVLVQVDSLTKRAAPVLGHVVVRIAALPPRLAKTYLKGYNLGTRH